MAYEFLNVVYIAIISFLICIVSYCLVLWHMACSYFLSLESILLGFSVEISLVLFFFVFGSFGVFFLFFIFGTHSENFPIRLALNLPFQTAWVNDLYYRLVHMPIK